MVDVSSLIIQSFIHWLRVMEFHRQAFPSAPPVYKNKQYVAIRVYAGLKSSLTYKLYT